MDRKTSLKWAAVALGFCLCTLGAPSAAQSLNPSSTEIDAFLRADSDANQWLNRAEFKVFVNAMARAGQPTAKKIRFFGAYSYAFSIADADKDGRITPMELRSADDDFRASDG